MEAATRNGIKPLDNEKKIQRLVHDGILEEISENATYKVDNLTHSYPYLVPKAVMLLEDIGELTQSLGKSRSRIIVTSGLRTKEMIEKAIAEATRFIYIRTGDVIAIELDTRKPLCTSEDKKTSLKATWCDNESMKFDIIM